MRPKRFGDQYEKIKHQEWSRIEVMRFSTDLLVSLNQYLSMLKISKDNNYTVKYLI